MSFWSKILDNIAEKAEDTQPYANIVYGSDPPMNGICMIPTGVSPTQTHFDKGMVYDLPIVLNGKNADQGLLLDDLTKIHEVLTRRTDYSDISTGECQVVDISTTALPSIIGREQNKQWVCGSSLNVKFYWRK
jgi:hypothetical protein